MNNVSLYGISPIVIYESFNDKEHHNKIKNIYYSKFSDYGFDYENDSRFEGVSNSSGESLGKSFLHKDKNFDEFFSFLKKNIIEYVIRLGFNEKLFSYHILKSWYVIIDENNGMQFHTHSGSDFSFCYYIDVPENSGKINFLNENINNKNCIFSGLFDYTPKEAKKTFIKDFNNPHTFKSYPFDPCDGKLLIFPSDLSHSVDQSNPGVVRHSISGDIKLTLKKDIINFESGLMHPSLWTEL